MLAVGDIDGYAREARWSTIGSGATASHRLDPADGAVWLHKAVFDVKLFAVAECVLDCRVDAVLVVRENIPGELGDGNSGSGFRRIDAVQLGKLASAYIRSLGTSQSQVPTPSAAARARRARSLALAQFLRCEKLICDVMTDDKYAIDFPTEAVDGAVTVGPVDILEAAVARYGDEDILLVCGLTAHQGSLKLWADDVPGLRPASRAPPGLVREGVFPP